MSSIMNLPFEWHEPGYFITYYGDVYYGAVASPSDHDDRFFIIQEDKKRDFRKLNTQERTTEKCREYGWEIRDTRIIKQYVRGDKHNPLGGENQYSRHSREGNFPYKRMFIFGAGASAYCAFGDKSKTLRESKLRPPTGFEIFDEDYQTFCDKYPGVSLTIPAYEAMGRDIEDCMEKEWQNFRYTYNPGLLKRHVNIQYYLQKLFTAISTDVVTNHNRKNLYSLFANKLQQHYSTHTNENFSVVSFNYDTILDHYIEKVFEQPFQSMDDYFNYKSPFLFFKPHGSCNWGWKFKRELINPLGRTGIANLIYNNNIELDELYYHYLGGFKENLAENSWGYEMELNPHRLGRHTLNKNRIEIMQKGERYYPALLLPYRDKDEFVMHYDHQQALETAMNEVEELYLIGWKGNEKVFNRLFDFHSHRLQKVIIVNPDEIKSGEVSKYLKDYPKMTKIKPMVYSTFEDFVLNHLDNLLIAQ